MVLGKYFRNFTNDDISRLYTFTSCLSRISNFWPPPLRLIYRLNSLVTVYHLYLYTRERKKPIKLTFLLFFHVSQALSPGKRSGKVFFYPSTNPAVCWQCLSIGSSVRSSSSLSSLDGWFLSVCRSVGLFASRQYKSVHLVICSFVQQSQFFR